MLTLKNKNKKIFGGNALVILKFDEYLARGDMNRPVFGFVSVKSKAKNGRNIRISSDFLQI